MLEKMNLDAKVKKYVKIGLPILAVLFLVLLAVYTVDEGHQGIVKRLGKATSQVEPGLHFKVPFIDSIEVMEIRTRKNVEENIPVATKEQMPSIATVSINWSIPKAEVLNLFIEYGGMIQFENRILDPKLRASAKEGVAKFTAEEIITNRQAIEAKIRESLIEKMTDYVVTIEAVQLEDIALPNQYKDAVMSKQIALQRAKEEEHKLAQQKLEAQRNVQTAEAERDARKAEADGIAYKVKTEARAEADAILMKGKAEAEAAKAVSEAIARNKLIVEYERVKKWKGDVPTTMMGDGANVLMGLGLKK